MCDLYRLLMGFKWSVQAIRLSLACVIAITCIWFIRVEWINFSTFSGSHSAVVENHDSQTAESHIENFILTKDPVKSTEQLQPTQPKQVITSVKNISFVRPTIISEPTCPESPPKLVGELAVDFASPPYEKIEEDNPLLKQGWVTPPDCKPVNGPTAIIIPYRLRDVQLRAFLNHMHPILQRQQLEYVIIVVDQSGESRFNRAMLMNIGYAESLKLIGNGTPIQCYIFHDVDLLPEDDRGLYTCQDKSIHLSAYIDKFNYKIPYAAIFGGASAIPRTHFELINGFSNVYFGWGGEDDDVHDRLLHLKLPIKRYDKEVLRYKMIKHEHEKTNKANDNRVKLLRKAVQRMHVDGINSLRYKVVETKYLPTHVHVVVDIDESEVYQAVFGQPSVKVK